jgi:hypothetical protein
MIVTTTEGFEAEIVEQGACSLQVICDKLNQTHFSGNLPAISALAVSTFKHPTLQRLNAITLKIEECPALKFCGTDWVILVHQRYCGLPEIAQLLLHEMTHVSLPDEDPYHSPRFWTTLKEKWLLDLDLVLGVGLNGDEKPSGLTKELLALTTFLHGFGL